MTKPDKFADMTVQEELKHMMKVDAIRVQKFLEISQSMLVAIFLGFVGSHYVERLFPQYREEDNKSAWRLILEVCGQSIVLGIMVFYLKKIMRMIPFMFKFTDDYNPSQTKDNMGVTLGLSVILVSSQLNYRAKLNRIREIVFNMED